VLNGARSVTDLVYKDEMKKAWEAVDGVRVVRTIDPGGETPEWDGEVGLLPTVFERLALPPDNRVVVVCGRRSCSTSCSSRWSGWATRRTRSSPRWRTR